MELYFLILGTFILFCVGYILGRLNSNYTLQNEDKKSKKFKISKLKKEEAISDIKDSEDEKVNKFYQ